ncbi:hypothetical protein LCGC14_1626880 [marine sediment metagenome]|uniref:AAA domain-containing protein n=1 Tax=marine sediment metagenome TaxID=412755 RepID=A0A0F9IQT9_9ZZZZ
MIEEIGIKHFKGIKHVERLKIKPISLFCGKNSSGKTSILESILLIKQSSEKNQSFNELILNGKYVRLGAFKDISWKNHTEGEISFTFKLRKEKDIKNKKVTSSKIELKFKRKDSSTLFDDVMLNQMILKVMKKGQKHKILSIDKSNPKTQILTWDLSEDFDLEISTHQGKIDYQEDSEGKFFGIIHKFENTIIFTRPVSLKIEDQQFYKITQKKNHPLIKIKEKIKSLIENFPNIEVEKKKNTLEELKNILKERKVRRIGYFLNEYEDMDLNKRFDKDTIKLFDNIIEEIERELVQDINSFHREISLKLRTLAEEMDKISFIGPLREEPSLRYTCEEQKLEIGNRGENAPLIFESEKKLIVEEFFLMEQGKYKKLKNKPSSEIWNLWSKYFKFGKLKSTPTSDSMFRFKINEHNLKHVGFGISQVFPILIEGVRIEKGNTLILEQPEIHLHPDLQMRLADFFISMGISGRNTIIETHSEHIINRIVRRVVEDNDHNLKELIGVYFVNMGKNGLEIEEIIIDKKGIINWPKGFFDEAMKEQSAILRKLRENQTLGEKQDD